MSITGTEEQRRQKRVSLAVANPAWFGETYMRPYDEEWTGPLPRVAVEMLGFATAVRRGVLMTPPEFLKTTVISQVYPLWLTYRYAAAGKLSLLHGALLSEYQELARGNLSVVAWHIQHNPLLARDFVDVHGRPLVEPDPDEEKWTDDRIVVRRTGASKDPTWQAAGINTQIQGTRLRHLIGDDVVTPLSSNSPAKQKEAKRIWDQQTTARLLEAGQAIIAGNFNHPKDLLSSIAARAAYSVMKRPAMHVAGDPETPPEDPRDPTAELALPTKWSRRRLLGELAEKPSLFSTMYLLRSGQKGGAALREAWVTKITLEEVPLLHRRYIIGLDPAPGADVDPDPSFFNLTVAILTHKHLDIVESYAARMETTEQVDLLADKVAAYQAKGNGPVAGIAISKVALDRYFKGAAIVGHPELRPYFHPHSIPQGSKEERLSALGTFFKSGWARILESAWTAQTSDPDDRDQETTFAEEWTTLPNQRHDDRLDGADLVIREAIGMGASPGSQVTAVAEEENATETETAKIVTAQW